MLDTLLFTLSVFDPVRAWPVAPIPLHELMAQSQLVAVVRPGVGEHVEDPDPLMRAHVRVELAVEEVLMGEDVASVTAIYLRDMVCPSPAKFPAGERVLAFLAHDEKGGWYPVALADGTKLLDPAALDVYRARIRELAAMMEERPKRWHESPEFIEWLVRCAEEPATRWEGADALDPTKYLFGDEPEWARTFGHRLDAAQRSRLAAVLFAARDYDRGESNLLRALVDEPGHAFEDQALARLPALLPKRVHFAGELMGELAKRSGDDELKRLAKKFTELPRNDPRGPRSIADFVRRARELRTVESP